ncbi:MAG: DUF262 domain-containing protein [Bacteroidales bacterium]
MENDKLKPIQIYQLLDEEFFIPSYQRGYRWSTTQVTQLLDDIWEFSTKKNKTEEEFYCLQPIVVKAIKDNQTKNRWEVLDGQQRLTTIRVFLSYLGRRSFSIEYETRPDSKEFLNNPEKARSINCIDFFYIWNAYETTKVWFEDKKKHEGFEDFLSLFTEEKTNPVKVIWYEIDEDDDSIDIFTRLNMGKIPLTNAELIKALFLGNANKKNKKQEINFKQLQIASEWDVIENSLQDESFWYFIYNEIDNKYDTKIEYIFDLMKNKKDNEDQYSTFYKFSDDFKDRKNTNKESDIEGIWLDIKNYFLTFQEWYNDRELYHLIGFIITTGGDIKTLKGESKGKTKSDFKKYIKVEISKIIRLHNRNIEELSYDESRDKGLIKKILLLTNIQTHLKNSHSKSRFPFDSYKKDKWDIEHIFPQTEIKLKGDERIEWALLVLQFYTGKVFEKGVSEEDIKHVKDIENDIGTCKSLIDIINKTDDRSFAELYEEINGNFKQGTPPVAHNISNLVLLDSHTNRSFKNAYFAIKRMVIINKEKKGDFIPVCTRNIFMKAYSKRFDKIMYWNKSDADDYMKEIKLLLNDYSPKIEEKHENV